MTSTMRLTTLRPPMSDVNPAGGLAGEPADELVAADAPSGVTAGVSAGIPEGPVTDQLDGSPIVREVLGDAYEPLALFHGKLMAEGEPRGLIGPRDVPIVWERHILNSAAIVPFVREAAAGFSHKTIADIGSGGGFPGLIVAACLPDFSVTLVEPMERRVEWLAECVELMGLTNVTIRRARAEELIGPVGSKHGSRNGGSGNGSRRRRGDRGAGRPRGRAREAVSAADANAVVSAASGMPVNENDSRKGAAGPERFAVVTCRAVAPMTKLAGWTLPLLAPGGKLVALKGRSAQAELDKAAKEISKAHGLDPQVVEAPVAPGLEPTHVVLITKR